MAQDFGARTKNSKLRTPMSPADLRSLAAQPAVLLARLLADLGYSVAFNTVRQQVDTSGDGRYELPRLDTRDLPPHTTSDEAASVAAAEGEGA